jgi:hypothetical protein
MAMRKGFLQIIANVPDADVVVNGQRVGKTSAERPLNLTQGLPVGMADVTVNAPGYDSVTKRVEIKFNEWSQAWFQLESEGTKVAQLTVRSNVTGDAWYLDGKPVGSTGPEAYPVTVGKHEVLVEKKGYRSYKKVIDVPPGSTQKIWAKLTRASVKPPIIETTSSIKTKNTSTRVKDGRWDWTVFIDTDPVTMARIDCVEYTLHKTFPNPVRKRCNPKDKFALNTNGWGTFRVKVKLMFKNGSEKLLFHDLVFRD